MSVYYSMFQNRAPAVLLRRKGGLSKQQQANIAGIYGGDIDESEKAMRAYINQYLQPEIFVGTSTSDETRVERRFWAHLLRSQIATITGYLGSPGNQELIFDADNLTSTQREAFDNAIAKCRDMLQEMLLYGRAIAIVLPAGAVEIFGPMESEMQDVYSQGQPVLEEFAYTAANGMRYLIQRTSDAFGYSIAEVRGEGSLNESEVIAELERYTINIPVVAAMLDRQFSLPAQPYAYRLASAQDVLSELVQDGLSQHKLHGRRFFSTPLGSVPDEVKRTLNDRDTSILTNVEKGELVEIGQASKDNATEAWVRMAYWLVEKETGIVDFQQQGNLQDSSGESLRYKIQQMDYALGSTYTEWRVATERVITLVSQTLGMAEPPQISFSVRLPNSKADEIDNLKLAGASKRTIFETLGLDADIELERLRDEMEMFRLV